MASIRRMSPEPTLPQVRDYVLTMLDGLSSLAETVDDQETSDRIRDFANELMMSWSPPCGVPAAGPPNLPAAAADESDWTGVEGRAEGASGDRLTVRKRP